jgi:uncharacterized membrane protein
MTEPPTTPVSATATPPVVVKHSRLFMHVRSSMFSGLITLVPLFITAYLLTLVFNFITQKTLPIAAYLVNLGAWSIYGLPETDPWVVTVTSWTAPILALLITIVVVYLLGVLSIFAIGRRILHSFEHFIENLPLVKGIYGTTKQVIGVFRQGSGGQGFQRVVLVQFPRLGTWCVAFVTNTVVDETTSDRLVCCFIPMTPNPTSGFFQMFPERDVRSTDWTVDMGIKIILSGGLLAPTNIHAGPVANGTVPPATVPPTPPSLTGDKPSPARVVDL